MKIIFLSSFFLHFSLKMNLSAYRKACVMFKKICRIFVLGSLGILLSLIISCRPVAEVAAEFNTNTELAEQVGDTMSSVDDAAGSLGTFAWSKQIQSAQKSIASYQQPKTISKLELLSKSLPMANAASCFGNGFSACSGGVITRNFNNCMLGSASYSGTVTLTYAGPTSATCKLSAASDTVTRDPNFQVATAVGTVVVAKTGTNGQMMSYVSGSGTTKVFSMTNDGVRRTITVNTVLMYDVTTATTTAVTVTGSDRTNRVLNGGTIRFQNNLTTEQCDISPSAVTWSGTCTCATSGTWTGTCQTKGAFTMAITGCGTANLTIGTETKAVTMNQCSGS